MLTPSPRRPQARQWLHLNLQDPLVNSPQLLELINAVAPQCRAMNVEGKIPSIHMIHISGRMLILHASSD